MVICKNCGSFQEGDICTECGAKLDEQIVKPEDAVDAQPVSAEAPVDFADGLESMFGGFMGMFQSSMDTALQMQKKIDEKGGKFDPNDPELISEAMKIFETMNQNLGGGGSSPESSKEAETQMKVQLKKSLKKFGYCPYCSTGYDEGALFCSHCGEKLEK